jgi:enolase
VEVELEGGVGGRAIAPAGASIGTREAVELRDGGAACGGFGVGRAVTMVDREIAPVLAGRDASDQAAIDRLLIDLDGTPNKSRLGANATVATSMAVAHAAAAALGIPLWKRLQGNGEAARMPLPEIQIFGGGAHAAHQLDVQDFMVIPIGAGSFAEALEWSADVYRAAGALLAGQGRLRGIADEGGYWPSLPSSTEVLALLVRAIERAKLRPGADVAIALDVAASQLGSRRRYRLAETGADVTGEELIARLVAWTRQFPIVSIEDPAAEDDETSFAAFTAEVGNRVEVVGDDLLVTDAARIRRAAAGRWCNAVLLKPNQVGTLTETLGALRTAQAHRMSTIVSARSGESEDVTIVHLAVGWGADRLKVGSFARSERVAKWNEGARIAEALGGDGPIARFELGSP